MDRLQSHKGINQDFQKAHDHEQEQAARDFRRHSRSDGSEIDMDELATPEREMHLTPGGMVEEIVHREVDARTRSAIRQAQARSREGVDERDQPLPQRKKPDDHEPERDDYRERMMDRFNHQRGQSYEPRL